MPFLKNIWYVAANAGEFDDGEDGNGLVSRTICNEQVVMYRSRDGSISAIHDRCPHRFVPLSMGKRIGDTLQCGYHGLRFDSAGACVEAPNDDDNQRARICVKAFPAIERYSLIWIWMGDPALADPSTIPEFAFMSNGEKYTLCQGYNYIKSNYQLISDNLLDLSHIHYLHPSIHKGTIFADFTNRVQRDGDTVWSMLWRHHYHIDADRRPLFGLQGNTEDVEGQGHVRWNAPGVLLIDTAWWDHGSSHGDGVLAPNAHLITPETETTSHYFWSSGRNFAMRDDAVSAATIMSIKKIFETQDGPMIEAQQRDMGESTDFLDHKPMILRADAAGVMARRIMKQKMRAESEVTKATAS